MEKIKVGFIGCGNMGGALASAVAKSENCQVLLYDISTEKAQDLAQKTGAVVTDIDSLVNSAKYIFLGVKPQMMPQLIDTIKEVLNSRIDRFILVTMAAGIKISKFNDMLGAKMPIIRIMPNTPVSVGEGMIVYSPCKAITDSEILEFNELLKFSGRLDKIEEELIDAACVVSGCGPAFVYMFAQSMAQAGEKFGLPKENSTKYAAQTLLGAAKLMLESGKSPEVLRQEVCSPKGSTIEGVVSLQNSDFNENIDRALTASFNRTKELGK